MNTKINSRLRRKIRIRKTVSGTPECPRFTVFRSLNQIYAQLVDDTQGKTLVAASSLSEEIAADLKNKSKVEKGKLVGQLIAKKAAELNLQSVVFDRNGFIYHGRVKAVADGAREGGLKF
jgi:large subunit ribosomal protein L18